MRRAGGALLASLWLVAALGLAASSPIAAGADADETDYGGFDESLDEGFDDASDEDPDEGWSDGFGGFDEVEDAKDRQAETSRGEARFWQLDGELSLGSSYNYISHESATGTPYGNLSRLRVQLDLLLDVDLPANWRSRVEGYAFYDFTYIAKGRSNYTQDVINAYEWEVDFRDVWLQGNIGPDLDMKLGRQIINWGRSDTLRVLDIINPLDNREPGLLDIENLRFPVTMARIDYYPDWIADKWGEWGVQLLVIPEFRADFNPPIGSDFNPIGVDPSAFTLDSQVPSRFGDNPEFGGAITGRFPGWDISFYAANVYVNQPLLTGTLASLSEDPPRVTVRFPRVTMAGAGGSVAFGSWLLKAEMAFFDGMEYNNVIDLGILCAITETCITVVEKQNLDSMIGVEYYGVNDVQIAIEMVHRHIFDFEDTMAPEAFPLVYAKEDLLETALRVSADFFNSRLRVTAVALLLGTLTDVGSTIRLEASYEVQEGLLLTGGIVLYQNGTAPIFSEIGDNDRLFVLLEYNF